MIEIDGFSTKDAKLVRKFCEEALSHTGIDIDLRVTSFLSTDPSQEASGGGGKVELGLHLVIAAREGGLGRLRLGFIIFEEVAHNILEEAGVPHDGLGEFFQELYAGWVQSSAFVASGKVRERDLVTTPIPPDPRLYELGKHVGAVLAGVRPNKHHLENWLSATEADPQKKELVRACLDRLSAPLQPESVADLFDEFDR